MGLVATVMKYISIIQTVDLFFNKPICLQLLESVELEHFISDVYYGEFLGKRKGTKFVSSIISWMNHHMPFGKRHVVLVKLTFYLVL